MKLPSNKTFGYFFSLVFLISSVYFFFQNNKLYIFFLILSCVFVIISITFPKLLLPLNLLWMKFGILLGKIINPIIFGIVFFFMITPIGLIRRLIGVDELQIKENHNQVSFWVKRESKIKNDSFYNQF